MIESKARRQSTGVGYYEAYNQYPATIEYIRYQRHTTSERKGNSRKGGNFSSYHEVMVEFDSRVYTTTPIITIHKKTCAREKASTERNESSTSSAIS